MPESFRFGHIEIRIAERQLLVDGEPAKLGARAFDVMLALIERRDRVVSKNELLDVVWPNLVVEENNLQVQISALRKILGPRAIATIPGRGYRFTLAAERHGPSTPAATDSVAPHHGVSSEVTPVRVGKTRQKTQRTRLVGMRVHKRLPVFMNQEQVPNRA